MKVFGRGAEGSVQAAKEEVRTNDWSWGPAWLRAELRMERAPEVATETVVDQVVREWERGEAVWIIEVASILGLRMVRF